MIEITVQGPRSKVQGPKSLLPLAFLHSLTVAVRFLPLASCLLPFAFFLGCAAQTRVGLESVTGELATVKALVEDVHAAVWDSSKHQKAGGNINENEPVPGWILAVGYASVPVSLLIYALAHRFKVFRWFKYGKEAR